MRENYDVIRINLPRKAEYVGFIRLSLSGLASKIGFDIDTIEDIKVAVSEVCNKIVSQHTGDNNFEIIFHLYNNRLKAFFTIPGCPGEDMFAGETGEFAKAIISSLMDDFSISCHDDCVITMEKNLGDLMNG